MDDSFEQVEEQEVFNQFGVYYGNCKNHYSHDSTGTLSIIQSEKQKQKQYFIEWKPAATEENVESDPQELPDWAFVNTQARKSRTFSASSAETPSTCLASEVESTSRRRRGHRVNLVRRRHERHERQERQERRSHPRSSRSTRHSRCHADGQIDSSRAERVQIPLHKVGSFRLNRKGKCVSIKLREEKKPSTYFTFSAENGSVFISLLCQYSPAVKSRKDPNLYTICKDNEEEFYRMTKSFSELNIEHSYTPNLWGFIGQLRENPYEATMGAFSKITDALVYRDPGQRPEEVSELLTQSLTRENADELRRSEGAASNDDYEMINRMSMKPVAIELDNCIPPPRGQPLTLERWSQGMDAEGRITDPQSIKKLIFRGGISNDLRPEVWQFLLGVFPWNSTHADRVAIRAKNVELYFTMRRQWESMTPAQEERFSDFKDRKSLIGKDVHRTDRVLPFFAGDDNPNVQSLMHILMTYVMYNFDLGYVQGMSDLLAPLLELFNNEVDAFWCFVGFMDRVGSNFDMDQEGMKQQLLNVRTLIAFLDPNLLNYFDRNDSGNMFFCFRWLIVVLKREFSRDDVMRIWEVLWSDLPCKNFQLLLCVAVLETEKHYFYKNNYSFNEILKHVNELSMHINLENMLSRAEGIYQLMIEKADELPDCVRVILGLPPLNIHLWAPPALPQIGGQSEVKRSPTRSKGQMSPQSNGPSGAGEPGTSGRATSPGSDSERESSIETLPNASPAKASLYPELPPDDFT